MKLNNLSIIFIIIAIPIILVTSYYISLQVDTIKTQTSYNSKLLSSAKDAIDTFEINTVEWNEELSKTAESKRRDIMAAINTFTTSFANNTGMGGATKETLLPYIPAIAFTLYDGYYIYSPTETKQVEKDDNGLAKFENGSLTYKDGTTYSHILKPFIPYSARYKNGNIDVVINYTLDSYITVYGTIDGGKTYVTKSGYLISDDEQEELTTYEGEQGQQITENLSEIIAFYTINDQNMKVYNNKDIQENRAYRYVYDENRTKVYFGEKYTDQEGNEKYKTFVVSTNGEKTDLGDGVIRYKKYIIGNNEFYQALSDGRYYAGDGEYKDIEQGKWYEDKKGNEYTNTDGFPALFSDVSTLNYIRETRNFNKWINKYLNGITVDNMIKPDGVDSSEIHTQGNIFGDYSETSVFNQHKREVIKQSMISNLNQAITSYSRNNENGNIYMLPILKETDWDQILTDVSIVAFVQDLPIGLKTYNNYVIATSTSNKEYINPNGIYLCSSENENYLASSGDMYYHKPYCNHLNGDYIIGYRNTDYAIKSYYPNENDKETIRYYYRHQNLANQACYYCLVQPELYEKNETPEQRKAYMKALARERYVSHEFKNESIKQ